jgi:hypothetical protein
LIEVEGIDESGLHGLMFGVEIESCNALYVELIVFVLIYSGSNVVKKFDHGHALFGAGQVGHRVAELTSTCKIGEAFQCRPLL